MLQPTAQEQYMLELLNRARLNPQAEANRLLGGNLNEGVPTNQTISTAPKQALAFNQDLYEAAQAHNQWMLANDIFSHTGANGSQPWDRATAAGYSWSRIGENIAWRGTTGSVNVTNFVTQAHNDLFVDAGIAGRGHRTNMMNPDYQEVGISAVTGEFTGYNSVMIDQLFGRGSTNTAFLTGVVYTDKVTNDNFYTVGEGLGNIAIQVVGNGSTFTTNSLDAGGYQLKLAPGTYAVSFKGDFNGDGVADSTQAQSVTIGALNVKLDFATDTFTGVTPPPPPTGNTITGTAASETLTGTSNAETILGLAGADKLSGGEGADTLVGGIGNDQLLGGNGNDALTGVDPNVTRAGASERDTLKGEAGRDRFILGNASQAFYVESTGLEGYGWIQDFNRNEDTIQLRGSAANYRLQQTSTHTRLYQGTTGTPNELVGVIQGDFTGLSLTASYFSYV